MMTCLKLTYIRRCIVQDHRNGQFLHAGRCIPSLSLLFCLHKSNQAVTVSMLQTGGAAGAHLQRPEHLLQSSATAAAAAECGQS